LAEPSDIGGRAAQTREADGDIVRRAAEHRVIGAGLDGVGNEIDERFAGNENHGGFIPP